MLLKLGLTLLLTAPFLKGQTHLHTSNSGDSQTPPADVIRWYQEHDYDFIVVTDHNFVTQAKAQPPKMLVIPGTELTQNRRECTPAPAPGHRCLLHVNALFVDKRAGRVRWPKLSSSSREAIFTRAMNVTRDIGGLAQLNHPNFHYAANAELLSALVDRGLLFFEVANMAWDSNNEGDARHPSTEAIWDRVLSSGRLLYGVATDDAHHYQDAPKRQKEGKKTFVGDLGFIMVRAKKTPSAIEAAMRRGDFYSSNGVRLSALDRGATQLRLATRREHTFRFIGQGGKELQRSTGTEASFRLKSAPPGYLRAEVLDAQGRKAWVQPIRTPTR